MNLRIFYQHVTIARTVGRLWAPSDNSFRQKCPRKVILQYETLLQQAHKHHLAFIILSLGQPWNLPLSLQDYAVSKCKSKGSSLYTTGLFVKRNEMFPELQIFLALLSDRDKLHFLFPWPEIRNRKQNLSSFPELISVTFRMESDDAQFYLLTQKLIQPQWPINLHF